MNYEEFSGLALVLSRSQSFDDVLVFDVVNFCSEITSDVTVALDVAYSGAVALGFTPDLSNPRRKYVNVTVRRPPNAVLRFLRKLYENDSREIAAAWSWRVLIALLLVTLAATGHAAFLLNAHFVARDKPLSVLTHFVLHNLARLYLFSSA